MLQKLAVQYRFLYLVRFSMPMLLMFWYLKAECNLSRHAYDRSVCGTEILRSSAVGLILFWCVVARLRSSLSFGCDCSVSSCTAARCTVLPSRRGYLARECEEPASSRLPGPGWPPPPAPMCPHGSSSTDVSDLLHPSINVTVPLLPCRETETVLKGRGGSVSFRVTPMKCKLIH